MSKEEKYEGGLRHADKRKLPVERERYSRDKKYQNHRGYWCVQVYHNDGKKKSLVLKLVRGVQALNMKKQVQIWHIGQYEFYGVGGCWTYTYAKEQLDRISVLATLQGW